MSVIANLRSPNAVVPSATGGVTVTPSGTNWTWGAYAEVLASAATDLLFTGFDWGGGNEWLPVDAYEVQFAVGGAGAEVPIATVPGIYGDQAGTCVGSNLLPFPLPVASGARIACRVRKAGTGTTPYTVTIRTVPAAYTGNLYPTTAVVDCLPSGTYQYVTASGTPWVTGSPSEVSAALPRDAVLFAAAFNLEGIGVEGGDVELDICTGGAGAETAIWTIRSFEVGMADPNWHRMPPIRVAAGTRLSLQLRCSQAGDSVLAKIAYYDNPSTSEIPADQLATGPNTIYPAAATPLSVSSPGTSAYGAWVEFIASAPVALAVVDVIAQDFDAWRCVQIGVGAAGVEAVVGTVDISGFSVNERQPCQPLPLAAAIIPAGARVALRMGNTDLGGTTGLALVTVPVANVGAALQTTAPPSKLPEFGSGITGNNVSGSGGAWTSGAFAELTAGLSDPICIYGISHKGWSGGSQIYEVDLATGGAGSETVLYTFRRTRSIQNGRQVVLSDALLPIPASTRIAARMRSTDGEDGFVALLYYGNLWPTPDPIVGALAVGYQGTVTKSRAFAVSLDGNVNTLDEVGKMKVFGDFEATGVATLPGLVIDLSALLDGLGT